MISVVILTKNEEQDLSRCLDALTWCDDIHVLDSESTDRTCEIARAYGATVTVNPFRSFGDQRNFALDRLPLQHEWILFLDADEVATDDFLTEMKQTVVEADENMAGYYCCWKMMLEERWLRRCDNFPKWQFRLLRRGRARFTDFGHGQKECDLRGPAGYIHEPYLHFAFSKGWVHWLDRHNRYSTAEAIARLGEKRSLSDVFTRNPSQRNAALKVLLTQVPGWPALRFFHAYFFKLGLLEGTPGFVYCANMAYYEFLIKIKMRELRIQQKNIGT